MISSSSMKLKTVIDKNTFYFSNPFFEEKYEGHISSLKDILLVLKNNVETEGLKKIFFEQMIIDKENGLRALLALTGFSNETLKRLTTIIRVVDDEELNDLVYKEKWIKKENVSDLKEWTDAQISTLVKENNFFAKGIVNIFFEGSTVPFLTRTIPLFELKKLSISKLKFELPEIIDTLIRYKERGSYSGMKENNPEILIEGILNRLNISFKKGDLKELIKNAPVDKRSMDFIIPDKERPRIIIESSFLTTTSSGQGDKAKTENSVGKLIRSYYPKVKFLGFIDGIGWYVRRGDLERMVTAYEDVFTFHKDELIRFEEFLKGNIG